MYVFLSDAQFNSIALILIAAIGIVPACLAAYWSRGAKKESNEANRNSAKALHEVQTNGGMSDPNPNLNDHVKYQTTMTEWLVRSFHALEKRFAEHLDHSKVMDQALAELYLKDRPEAREWPDDDLPQPPI